MNEVAREYRRLLEMRKAYHPAADIDWDSDPLILGMVKALSADVDATVDFLGSARPTSSAGSARSSPRSPRPRAVRAG